MDFSVPLIRGRFVKHYKRFFIDVFLEDDRPAIAYCANTGKMTGLLVPDSKIWLSPRPLANKGLPYVWEVTEVDNTWVGVNTHNPNRLVKHALAHKKIEEFLEYAQFTPEVLYEKGTRFDFLLKDPLLPLCYVEVKIVHLKQGDRAFFPDTVTERGRKHMETLALLKEKTPALRAVVLFIIQRQDCDSFAIAEDINPQYARAAKQALNSGVEFIAYRCKISSQYLRIDRKVPIYW